MINLILMAVGIANYYDLAPDMFTRLVYAESRFDPAAVSSSGCVGLCQINLKAWPLDEWVIKTDDPFDPYANLMQGGHILAWGLKSNYDDRCMAVSAYTLGQGRVNELQAYNPLTWWRDMDEPIQDYMNYVARGQESPRWGTWSWRDAVAKGAR